MVVVRVGLAGLRFGADVAVAQPVHRAELDDRVRDADANARAQQQLPREGVERRDGRGDLSPRRHASVLLSRRRY
jgi:DNA-binding response OmpR family regulator